MTQLDSLIAELTSGDDTRAEAAVSELASIGRPAIATLVELLESEMADHRWWATRALSEFSGEVAEAGLLRALADPDASVRQCAALGLGARPTPAAIEPLIDCLDSQDSLLGRLASDALAAIGQPAIQALATAARSNRPLVRIGAVRSLAIMQHPEAIGPLFRSIEDPSSMVVHWAEHGLDRLGVGMAFFRP